jgi:hypothetical protein
VVRVGSGSGFSGALQESYSKGGQPRVYYSASRRVSEINRGGVKCYIPENVRQPGHLAISKTRTLTLGAAADASAAVEHRPAASSSNNVEGIEMEIGLESFLLILELDIHVEIQLPGEAWTSVRTIK